MKKKIFRVMLTALSVVLILAAMVIFCSAEKTLVAEGYCVAKASGSVGPTNVKWEIFEENEIQTIFFSIDKSKESANTVLHAKDKNTGADIPYYKAGSGEALPWGAYTAVGDSKVEKAVIGDGITEISGAAFAYSSITTVEIPKTLVTLSSEAFNRATALSTVNITGEEENPGVVNLKYITSIPNNIFGGPNSIKKYIFNPDYEGEFGGETFSRNASLKEIEIPAGVTSLGNKIFTGSNNLAYLTILGKETVLTNDTFGGLTMYPRIVGCLGSAAETFAKENGYTFINIETNEEVHKGTKPLAPVVVDEINPFVPVFEEFDPTGATAYGHMTSLYGGNQIIDTYWAYYADTKTLKLVSGTKSYNETGRIASADDGKGWTDYLEQIEHVVVGDYISKLSTDLCRGMISLKSVELSRSLTQVSTMVFYGCVNLTTVYYRGDEKIEGLADFSTMKLSDVIGGTRIRTLKIGSKNEDLEGIKLPLTLEKIITPFYDSDYFNALCEESEYDLQDANNPENIKEHFIRIELDPSWPACGFSAAFEFDEATGTLTVHGKGAIDDIPNYYGGGSKLQPWFSIRDKIKHIVITDYITTIGKYAFAECVNLETVCLPNVESIEILNAAFEKCYNLKSVYIAGTEPIEGTFDLRLIKGEIPAWTFAYNYLVANVIVDESVTKVGTTTFEENLGVNLTGVYGVPGSYAETYATDNGLTFHDISKGMPSAVTCTPPEPDVDTDVPGDDTTISPDTGDDTIVPDTTDVPDNTDTDPVGTTDVDNTPEPGDNDGSGSVVLIVVIVVVVVLVVAACVVILVIKAKKSPKNDK